VSAEPTTILLTGIGIDAGPDVIRALRADAELGVRIVGVDSNAVQAERYLCDSFHQVPPRDDPDYVEAVARIAERESARVIYPLPSSDQEIFGEAREKLEGRGLAVPVSPPEAVRICNDKWLLYEHLRPKLPELIPETRRVSSAEQLANAVRSLGYPERRVCIRRPTSRGAMGLRVLDPGPARVTALLHENPGGPGSLLMALDEALDVLGQAEAFPDYLVQEYLPGDEWDVDILCREGEPIIVASRHNISMTVSAAIRTVLERSEALDSVSREIVADLGLNAVVSISFKHVEDGAPRLLEINPRIPFSVLCAMSGGVNLVALAVRQSLGERIEPVEPRWGGEFLRTLQSVLVDETGSALDL
jgi:carbamoyl-phosphate synthase large subunit